MSSASSVPRTATAFRYVEGAYGGARNRNKVLFLEDFKPNGYADCYRSMLRFPEAFKAYVAYNDGSVSGYAGEAKADFFPADFDNEADLGNALEDARQTARRWEAVYGLPSEALRYYFSGSKGIHIEIPEHLFGGLEPGRGTAARLASVAREMLGESKTADLGIYDTTRLWRAPNTRHKVTRLFKTPLYPREFFNFGIEEIRDLAKEKRDGFVHTDPTEFEPVPELGGLWRTSQAAGDHERPHERLDTSALLNGVSKGERDTAMFKLACKLRAADVPKDLAEVLVAKAAENCEPPFSEREARKKVASAYQRYSPNDVGDRYRYRSPYSESNGNDQKTIEIVQLSKIPRPTGRRPYLVEGVIPERFPTAFYGDGGTAKSTTVLHLVQALARGESEWLGHKIARQANALYIDFELDLEEQVRRAYEVANGMGYTAPPDGLHYLNAAGHRVGAVFHQALAFCQESEVDVILIDSLGVAMEGDAELSRDVLGFTRYVMDPMRAAGITPLVVDHQSKLQAGERYQSKTMFGSVYKTNTIRSVFQVEVRERVEDGVKLTLRHKKVNFGRLLDPFGAMVEWSLDKTTITPEDLTSDELAEEGTLNVADRILHALEGGPAFPDELAAAIGAEKSTVKARLSALRKAGKVEDTGEVRDRSHQVRLPLPLLRYSSIRNGNGNDGTDALLDEEAF